MADLLGLRAFTCFEDDVDEIGRLVEARLPVDLRAIDKRQRGEPVRFDFGGSCP